MKKNAIFNNVAKADIIVFEKTFNKAEAANNKSFHTIIKIENTIKSRQDKIEDVNKKINILEPIIA